MNSFKIFEFTTYLDDNAGAKLKEARLARGLTIEKLAEQAMISKSLISAIEKGQVKMTAKANNKISTALNFYHEMSDFNPDPNCCIVAEAGYPNFMNTLLDQKDEEIYKLKQQVAYYKRCKQEAEAEAERTRNLLDGFIDTMHKWED